MKTALLVPCFNAESCLVSLKKQIAALDPKFDEVILVDDGSTDGTVASAKNIGLTIIPLGVNRGPGAARNAAAQKSRADWIHFHDADDEIHSKYLDMVIPFATKENDVVLSSTEFVEEKTRSFIMRWEFHSELWTKNPVLGALRTGVNTTSSFIRKSKFDEIGGFNETYRCWEDGDMHLRLALAGAKFKTIPHILCTSLRHDRGTSRDHLYCHRCRLAFLKEYSSICPASLKNDLVKEIMQNAEWLYQKKDLSSVDQSVKLALKNGWRGPETRNPYLHLISKIPSALVRKWAFYVQMKARANAQT